jgi:hypothetical protein
MKTKTPESVLAEMKYYNNIESIRHEFLPFQMMMLKMECADKFNQAHVEIQAKKLFRFEEAVPIYERIYGKTITLMPVEEAEKIKAERDKLFEKQYEQFKQDQKKLPLRQLKELYPAYFED